MSGGTIKNTIEMNRSTILKSLKILTDKFVIRPEQTGDSNYPHGQFELPTRTTPTWSFSDALTRQWIRTSQSTGGGGKTLQCTNSLLPILPSTI